MNTLIAKYKHFLALIGFSLALAIAAVPQTAFATGETYKWNGDKIIADGGAFDAAPANGAYVEAPPSTVPFSKDGSVYRASYALDRDPRTNSGACTFRFTITLNSGSTSAGTIKYETPNCGVMNLSNPISITGTPPGSGGGTGGGTTTTGEEAEESADPLCDADPGELNFLVCPAINFVSETAKRLDCVVLDILTIDTAPIFGGTQGEASTDPTLGDCLRASGATLEEPTTTPGNTQSSQAFRTAWGVFRNISFALLLIFGLIMIGSQILGLEMFDAYTIRKMLPRLVIAVIFVSLSWNIMNFFFNMSNDAAYAIMDLIKAPFKHISAEDGIGAGDISLAALIPVILLAGAGVVAGLVAILGIGGVAAIVLSILLAVFSAFILLAARNVVAYLLIIAAPLAIMTFAFEPFKKIFTLWKTLLITILLSVPAIAAVIAISHVGALVAYVGNSGLATMTAVVILIAGYAMIWGIFKKLDQVAGQLGNIVSSVTGRMQKGLSDYRSNTMKRRFGEAVEGRRNFKGVGGFFANRMAGTARRARVASQAGGSWRGEAYKAGQQKLFTEAAAKMVEQDRGRSSGDDETMEVLKEAPRTAEDAATSLMELSARNGRVITRKAAMERIRSAEANLGASVGTSSMAVAAHQALLASNTGLAPDTNNPDAAYEELYAGLARQVLAGRISTTDAAAMIGSNKQRVDRQAGFGTRLEMMERAVSRVREGQSALTGGDVERLRQEAAFGSDPGTIIGARHEALTQLAPALRSRFQQAMESYREAQAQYDANPNDTQLREAAQRTRAEAARQAASLSNIYQYASYASEQKGRILADGVMGQPAWEGSQQTIQATLDSFREDPAFLALRQEFRTRYGSPEEMATRIQAQQEGEIRPPRV